MVLTSTMESESTSTSASPPSQVEFDIARTKVATHLLVQTAGGGGEARPELSLLGLVDARGVRDELLRVRDAAARARSA